VVFQNNMHFVTYTKLYLAIAAFVMVAAAAIIGWFGLPLGIDFTGGSLTEVTYETLPDKATISTELEAVVEGGFSLRESIDEAGRPTYLLRTQALDESGRQAVDGVMATEANGGTGSRFTSIGPVIGQELKDKAGWAIGGVVLIIVLYVAFAFRGVGKPVGSFVYGGITIAALLHDVLVPAAVMALLGAFLGAEVDVLFVMAILAVLGYSVNDTIVVFDRVRENLVKYRQEKKVRVKNEYDQWEEKSEYTPTRPFTEVVGESLDQALLRSINTSVTTFVALLALYIFGAEVTQTFALVLMAGVVAGAYSSIFFASPLLVYIAQRKEARGNK